MRGDFSRNTYRPKRGYSRVLWPQGRVILGSDLNEQGEIQVRVMRQMMRDLVGPHGGPADALGFAITSHVVQGDIVLEVRNGLLDASGQLEELPRGRYYVDGILVENGYEDGAPPIVETGIEATDLNQMALLVVLEVWERHVTWIEENEPFRERSMREVALGGPDTASRAQVQWRVHARLRKLPPDVDWTRWVNAGMRELQPAQGTMAASVTAVDVGQADPCRDAPVARYRGLENRLYRVEIHEEEASGGSKGPTFKWSRENGSVVYPIDPESESKLEGEELQVELMDLGRDDRGRLRAGDVVELVTAESDRAGEAGPLLEVVGVDEGTRMVRLRAPKEHGGQPGMLQVLQQGMQHAGQQGMQHAVQPSMQHAVQPSMQPPAEDWALLRRWDHSLAPKTEDGADAKTRADAVVIEEGVGYVLEDGIVVRFQRPAKSERFGFRAGDYWLIPARTIPGDIEWPRVDGKDGDPVQETPHGVERHYAPLAIIGEDGPCSDLRRKLEPLASAVDDGVRCTQLVQSDPGCSVEESDTGSWWAGLWNWILGRS